MPWRAGAGVEVCVAVEQLLNAKRELVRVENLISIRVQILEPIRPAVSAVDEKVS